MNHVFEARFARVGETATHYRSVKLTSTHDSVRWALDCLSSYFDERLNQEEFLVATLNTKHCVQRVVRITRGLLDSSLVHPREVFLPAIMDCASAILLVHNHPSGEPTPSKEDYDVTDRLTEAGKVLGITVLDHIVVGERKAVSIREIR